MQARNFSDCVYFKLVIIKYIFKEILALDAWKATQRDDKIIKNNSNIFSNLFQANFNKIIEADTFPEQLKYTDVKPDF